MTFLAKRGHMPVPFNSDTFLRGCQREIRRIVTRAKYFVYSYADEVLFLARARSLKAECVLLTLLPSAANFTDTSRRDNVDINSRRLSLADCHCPWRRAHLHRAHFCRRCELSGTCPRHNRVTVRRQWPRPLGTHR